MIVVIDTNVLVSAVIRDRDPEAVIQHVGAHSQFTWIATSEILTEYSEVLARPVLRFMNRSNSARAAGEARGGQETG